MKNLNLVLGSVLLVIILFAITLEVQAKRQAFLIPVPDTTSVKKIETGSQSSKVALGGGVTSVLLDFILLGSMASGSLEDAPVAFALGGIVGLISVIAGIVGLGLNQKWKKSGNSLVDKKKMAGTRRRSIFGIVVGCIGLAISIMLIAMDSGVMGF